MKIIDFTHTIEEEMSCYCEEEKISISNIANIDENGYECKKINIFTHTGTHVDSPRHMSNKGRYIDEYTLEELTGRAIILNLEGKGNILREELAKYENDIKNIDYVIINTNWSRHWNSELYLKDYRILSKEGAEYLSSFKVKGVLVDTISIGRGNNEKESHEIFLSRDILIVENLRIIEEIKGIFQLVIAPLKVKNSDGAPARVFGIID